MYEEGIPISVLVSIKKTNRSNVMIPNQFSMTGILHKTQHQMNINVISPFKPTKVLPSFHQHKI